jgi:hypothetical protein
MPESDTAYHKLARWSGPACAVHWRSALGPTRVGHLCRHPSLQNQFLVGDILEGGFTARFLEVFEAIDAVSALAHQFTGLGYIAELYGQFQQADLYIEDLLFGRHRLRVFRGGKDSTELSDEVLGSVNT